MFEVGERVLSRFGVMHKVLEKLDDGWYRCCRLEDDALRVFHESELRKLYVNCDKCQVPYRSG